MSLVYSQDTGGQSSPNMSSRSDDAELVITLKSRGRTTTHNPNKVNESAGRQLISINDDESHHVTNLNYQVKQSSSTSVCNNSDQVIEESMLPMETPSAMSVATCSELLTKSDVTDDDDVIRIKEEVDTSDDSECSSDVIVVSLDNKVGEKRKKILLSEEQHNQPMKKVRILSQTESMPSTSDMISSTTETMSSTSTNDDEKLNIIQVDPAEFTIKRKVVHECVVCNEKFKSITELFSHRVEHNEKTPLTFRCSKCDATFSEPLDLEQHQLLHIENRAFQCSFCQETFTTLHNFKCHLRIHNTRGPLVCNMCYQVFDKKKQFISHMDDHAWGNSNIRICHQCTVCKKYFSDSSKLKRHMLRHYMGKPYKCEICPKDFLEKHKLTRHMLTHTGVKEHVCPHCDKAFTLRFNLATHLKIHGNERRFQCHVCKRTFVQKVVLQRHLRIHQDYINDVLDKGGAAS